MSHDDLATCLCVAQNIHSRLTTCVMCGVSWSLPTDRPERKMPAELAAAFRLGGTEAVLALTAANPGRWPAIEKRIATQRSRGKSLINWYERSDR